MSNPEGGPLVIIPGSQKVSALEDIASTNNIILSV